MDPIQPCRFRSVNEFKDFFSPRCGISGFYWGKYKWALKKKELTKKAENVYKTSEIFEKTIFCQLKCKLIFKNTWIVFL